MIGTRLKSLNSIISKRTRVYEDEEKEALDKEIMFFFQIMWRVFTLLIKGKEGIKVKMIEKGIKMKMF